VSYDRAIQEIVQYTTAGTQFERHAIVELADEHGEDPKTVARDVAQARI